LRPGRIEGAGEWKISTASWLPLALPAIASLRFQFIWVWKTCWSRWCSLGGNVHSPLTIFLYDPDTVVAANYWIVSTGAVVSIFVPLIVFFSFQRYFVRGVLAGAVQW